MRSLNQVTNQVLLNELFDKQSYNTQSIKDWYEHCKLYIIGSWFNDLNIESTIDVDKEYEKVSEIIENTLRNQVYHMFKQMYNDEYMLGLLSDYRYSHNDSEIYDMLEVELNKTCDWLIELCIYALRYHALRATDDDVVDAIKMYGKNSGNAILNQASIYVNKIGKLELSYFERLFVGYDKQLLYFLKDYTSGKFLRCSVKEKLIAINEFKDIAHYHGTLFSGTDPFYIFDDEHEELYNSITQLNKRKLEKRLQELVGY